MKIAVLGTGMVGQTIASKLIMLGHTVAMGSRTSDNPQAREWERSAGVKGSIGTYEQAAREGEIIFNCIAGVGTIDGLKSCRESDLNDKILIDIANPLDFSKGMPPTLFVGNTDSLAETIQRTFPGMQVVKTLNTVNCNVMVNPGLVPGEHDMFISGNDDAAKGEVTGYLKSWFGWKTVIDLGDLSAARMQEAHVLFWVRLFVTLGTPNVNIKVARD